MSEQELKLNVPVKAQARVEREVQRAQFAQVQLRALYFDTPSRALVRSRIALRLRLEGTQWVQTLKMPGAHSLSRVEINQNRSEATLDLSIYAGTPAGDILSNLTEPLQVCYETDVLRLLRNIRARSGVVELAYDRGWLRAGALQLPISEVEFELKTGKLEAVFEIGRKWQQKFGLILDFRSKAERGDQLAMLAQTLEKADAPEAIANFWKPRGAEPIALQEVVKERDAAQVLSVVTSECLEHIARNAAILCEVDTADICRASTPEHVHQLRVGIRRLRSAWSFFNGITELPPLEHREQISGYFSQLGGTRDEDVLQESVLPTLYAAGLPPIELPSRAIQGSGLEFVSSPAFQTWLLDMLKLCTIPVSAASTAAANPAQQDAPVISPESSDTAFAFPRSPRECREPPLKPLLIEKLKKWHRQIVRSGLKFGSLTIEEQHALRKKSKRLRYALQFCESMLPDSNLQRYRKQLATVQDILGEMNDLYVAQPLFKALVERQPQAWFACGWIQARLAALTNDAAEAFKCLADSTPPWS